MDRKKINEINVERLSRWKGKLNDAHSTPAVLVGFGHDHKQGEVTVLCTEEMTDFQVLTFLEAAVKMLSQQIASKN